ncbi:helix-turn-helix domain-containing protein [Paenibacillus elgii]|uniref:helix-turn-helix domain-containing protein n=1 Tax=Paenibacillus elgii TaxID=189691 RepID=UPI000248C960|nr:helix-turn-helix domain-containing protein [Paenibacillus elgii]
MNTVGDRIRELRTKRSWTQDYLGEKLQMRRTNVANYENGRIIPPTEILTKIADIFGVSVDYLLGRTDDPHQIFISKEDDFSDQEQILLKKFMIETEELLRSKGDISEEKLSHVLEFMGWVFRKEAEEKNKSQS